MRLIYYLVLCCLNLIIYFFPFQIYSKSIRFDHLSELDGLPHNFVTVVAQDHYGFIWIGTINGLCKYDGYRMTVFQHDKNDSTSLINNIVRSILVDSEGTLWIETGKNGVLEEFNPNNKQFIHHHIGIVNEIGRLIEDKTGNLWFTVRSEGIARYNKNNKKTTIYPIRKDEPEKGPISMNINCLTIDENDNLWMVSDKGYSKYMEKTQKFMHYHNKLFSDNNPLRIIKHLRVKGQNVLWVNAPHKPIYQIAENRSVTTIRLADPKLTYKDIKIDLIYQDKKGTIWLYLRELGLYQITDTNNNEITGTLFSNDLNHTKSLSNNIINDITEDNMGNLWIATQNKINKVDLYSNPFFHYCYNPITQKQLNSNQIFSFLERSNGEILIGTQKGVNILLNNQILKFEDNYPNVPEHIKVGQIRSIVEDKNGTLWFGGANALISYNTGKQTYKVYDSNRDKTFDWGLLWKLHYDNNNNIWIGLTGSGIYKFNLTTEKIHQINEIPTSCGSHNTYLVSCIHTDSEGNTWFESNRHFIKYTKETNTYYDFHCESPEMYDFSLKCIYEDEKGLFWMGTEGQGMICFDPKMRRIKHRYTLNDGLPDNTVWAILPDDNENLWLSTNNGISRFSKSSVEKKPVFRNYDRTDGVQGNNFNQGAYLKTLDGHIYMGGKNGFNKYKPDSIKDNPFSPQVEITGFKLFGINIEIGETRNNRIVLDSSILVKESITLFHAENNFTFEFSGLHYSNPNKLTYAYKLVGYDTNWNFTSADFRIAHYMNLAPGEYTFKVKAANSDMLWSKTVANKVIILLPPWWKTRWAYSVYCILSIAVIIIIRYYTLKRLKLKNSYEVERLKNLKNKEIQRLKTDFFMNVSHEFRTPITLILGPIEKLINANDIAPKHKYQHKLIHRNANRLLRLINQLLDLRKFETKQLKLNVSRGDIIQFIEEIVSEFKSLAERYHIKYKFVIENEKQLINKKLNVFFDADKLEKILYNIISNAFKYTPEGGDIKISIKFENINYESASILHEDSKIIIMVWDSGIGISKEQLPYIFDRFYRINGKSTNKQNGSGIGLALTKELVEFHNGKIEVDSELNKGTRFIIELPINHNQTENDMIVNSKTKDTNSNLYPDLPNRNFSDDVLLENSSQETPKILIIEDNYDIRTYIANELNSKYDIIEAENGKIGLEISQESIPDLIICDIMMPEMDGIEFCERIKEDTYTCHIPVILLTARSSNELQLKGLETGADGYITKPFNSVILDAKIQNLIIQRQKLRSIFSARLNSSNKTLSEVSLDIGISESDAAFLSNIEKIVMENMHNADFKGDEFALKMNMSYSKLYRKVKMITNQSLNVFIRNLRLRKAASMLKEDHTKTISEIGYDVGFKSHTYFTRMFTLKYGTSPTNFISGNK